MDLNKVLTQLIMERDLIDKAIAHLERLSTGRHDLPGRARRRAHAEKPQEKTHTVGL